VSSTLSTLSPVLVVVAPINSTTGVDLSSSYFDPNRSPLTPLPLAVAPHALGGSGRRTDRRSRGFDVHCVPEREVHLHRRRRTYLFPGAWCPRLANATLMSRLLVPAISRAKILQ
jgi:hypothetical protein